MLFHRSGAGKPRPCPRFGVKRVIPKLLELLRESLCVQSFYSVQNLTVQAATLFLPQRAVRNLVRQRVFKRVRKVGKPACIVEEASTLQSG